MGHVVGGNKPLVVAINKKIAASPLNKALAAIGMCDREPLIETAAAIFVPEALRKLASHLARIYELKGLLAA